jgi:hypothetical protein
MAPNAQTPLPAFGSSVAFIGAVPVPPVFDSVHAFEIRSSVTRQTQRLRRYQFRNALGIIGNGQGAENWRLNSSWRRRASSINSANSASPRRLSSSGSLVKYG